jgi:osmotically-inducible protein OsmY
MKRLFTLVFLGATSFVMADCPYGNCPASGGGQQYQNQPYNRQGNPSNYQDNYRRDGQDNRQGNYDNRQGGYDRGYDNRQNGQGYYSNDNRQDEQGGFENRQNGQGGFENRQGYYDRSQGNNDQKSPEDQELAKKVRDVFSGGVFSKGYPNVRFDINNGTVILRGNVDTASDKTKVEESVKKIDGVKQVDNQLNVTQESASAYRRQRNIADNTDTTTAQDSESKYPQDYAATDSDRTLNAKIREKLGSGWFTKGYETVILRTKDGTVTISGIVGSYDDVNKINEKLKDVDGIKNLNNQVSVKK